MADEENVHRITIKSNSVISKTVTRCLNVLKTGAADSENAKEALEITADARAAGKAITVVEIVKRRITEHGGKVIQTTRVQEQPDEDVATEEQQPKTHLQGEGYKKPRKKVNAQIIIVLENEAESNVV